MKRLVLAASCASTLALLVFASQRTDPLQDEILSQTPSTAIGAIHPRISPDGSTIAFSYQGAIWTTPREGRTMTRLTRGPGVDLDPAWSADGQRIALVRSPNMFGGEVRLIRADGGQEIPLPKPVDFRGLADYQKLYFHPDGQRLLGHFFQDGKLHGLGWYDLRTGKITSFKVLSPWGRFALAPDGSWIVYSETQDVVGQQTGNDGPQADLWNLPSDGGKPEHIVRFPSRVHDLCVTADGKAILVVSELGGAHYDIWRVPLDDPLAGMQQWTFGQADECRPSMSQDGHWLVYSDNHAGPTAIMVRDLHKRIDQPVRIKRWEYGAPVGELGFTIQDAVTGKPITARVSVQEQGGKFHAPPGALYRMLRGLGHFYCEGETRFLVPAGKYRIRVFHGPEYVVHDEPVEVRADNQTLHKIALKRWTHQANAGWFSGENHIHANYGYGQWYNSPRTMLQQCAGEDLNVCNFMVANSDTDGIFDRRYFRGGPDPLSRPETILYWNQEFRSTLWGHMTLVNLKQLVEPIMTGFKDTTNPWDIPTNAAIADRTHWQKGVVNYTHIAQNPEDPFQNPYAAKGLPIDVALGKIETLDINNSYAGAVPIWHRLLNCGFRIPATAGTDCFLNRIGSNLPGGDRVYVKVDGPLSYEK